MGSAVAESSEVIEIARSRILAEAQAVLALAETIDSTLEQTASLVLRVAGKVFVGGSGTSGTVAARMAHVLSVSGTPAISFSPMDGLHGASGALTGADLIILISNGGASEEVIECAKIAQRRGCRVVALTRSHETLLAQQADHSVAITVDPEADIGGVIATGITIAQAAWGDALAEVLMRGRQYSWADFISTHPAGAVGQLEDLPPDLAPVYIATQGTHGSER